VLRPPRAGRAGAVWLSLRNIAHNSLSRTCLTETGLLGWGGRTRRLDRLNFMFFRDALVWFAIALEAVLEFAVAFGKLRQNFITAWRGIT
jgi:hypothetical protein